LLQKAWSALSAVDTSQDSFKEDPGVATFLDEIMDLAKKYTEIYNG
jgi:hypothetical protein